MYTFNSWGAFLQFFSANSVSTVRDLLAAWAASHRAFINAAAHDWSSVFANATVFLTERFLGNRLCVDFSCKICRDDLCSQLSVIPLCQTNWSDARVTTRLTQLE